MTGSRILPTDMAEQISDRPTRCRDNRGIPRDAGGRFSECRVSDKCCTVENGETPPDAGGRILGVRGTVLRVAYSSSAKSDHTPSDADLPL